MAKSVEEAASKSVAGTALGLSIGALSVELLNGGIKKVVQGLLGGNNENSGNENGGYCSMGAGYMQFEIDSLRSKLCDDAIALTNGIYQTRLTDISEKYAMREKDVAEKFSLYKYATDGMAGLQNEISCLKTEMAVMKAVEPYKDQLIANAINLEAERRACADGKIVCYVNDTFQPVQTVGFTADTTNLTARTLRNPLCHCA